MGTLLSGADAIAANGANKVLMASMKEIHKGCYALKTEPDTPREDSNDGAIFVRVNDGRFRSTPAPPRDKRGVIRVAIAVF